MAKRSERTPDLQAYASKRDFARTPEPAPEPTRSASGRLFVVQKHAASRLHYDLRLELDGVLKSWAVPKGPSLDPSQKPLAVHTEDHPLAYGDFEGVIPEGEYGAGTVMLWDRGEWEPLADPHEGYAKGDLKFSLRGRKLRGDWVLARMKGKAAEDGENWLLIKKRDGESRSISEYNVLSQMPRSVLSGRTMREIGESPERLWSGGQAVETGEVPGRRAAPLDPMAGIDLEPPGSRRAPMPQTLKPQLAVPASKTPTIASRTRKAAAGRTACATSTP